MALGVAAGTVALVVALVAGTLWLTSSRDVEVVVGKTKPSTSVAPTTSTVVVEVPPPDLGRPPVPEPGPAAGLKGANGRGYGSALTFRSNVPVPKDLRFILVAGSDARPGEDMARTRADSIHLLAVNPRTLEGTVLGFPRDAWVQIPGYGNRKINQALALGGPQLLAETVRNLTGLPVHYWVLTGFGGLTSMVDELGGVDIYLDRRMNDANSGARFEPGWHHFNGTEALAFSRDRKSVPHGDFSRSENQGKLILAALAKLRAEVADDSGLARWTGVLLRHVRLDVPRSDLPALAALARRLAPERVRNAVVPGKVGYAGSQSVVYLGEDAARIFADLRPDAVLGGAGPEVPPDTTTTSSTTSSTSTSTSTPLSTTTTAPVTTTTLSP